VPVTLPSSIGGKLNIFPSRKKEVFTRRGRMPSHPKKGGVAGLNPLPGELFTKPRIEKGRMALNEIPFW